MPRPKRPPDGGARPQTRLGGHAGERGGRDDRGGTGCDGRSLALDRRALSTTLDYTLSLALATIVITGLVIAASDFVSSQRQSVARTQMGVIGERIVLDLTQADRLVEAGRGSTTVEINQSLPDQVTGIPYSVSVAENSGTNWVNLTTNSPDLTVSIRFDTATPVAERSVDGGDVSVVYTGSELEVRS